ncbi:MAG TPA: ABC transporter permease [Vicinamibacterales bacterium]|nr:ABC transporter permease [Vicinamibacterales bacterium]
MRNWKSEVRSRLAKLDVSPTRHAAIAEEVGQHLEDRYAVLVARGVSPEAADRAVLQELSDSDVLAREVQALVQRADPEPATSGGGGGRPWLESLWLDLRYGARTLRRSPGFTAVAAITLALGAGATTAIFTIVNAVVLRPLPFTEPDRLVRFWESNPEKGFPTFSVSQPNFLDWRSQSRTFERIAASGGAGFTLTSGGDPEIIRASAVTEDFLPVLGATPSLGRNFRSEEDRPGGRTNVAILTHRFWQRRLASSPGVLGTTLTLDGRPFEVIGVLPASFAWGGDRLDLFVPLAPDPARSRADHRLLVIGRLAPGVSLEQAESEMNGIAAQLGRQYPDSNGGWSVRLRGFYDWFVPQETRDSLTILMSAVGLVLLIACGNVASLMLARGASRQKEISVRIALGAERSRIVRQLLVESMLIALIAGALGLAIASVGTKLLIAAGPAAGVPRLDELTIDTRVFGFALATAILSGLFFGLVPALQASRPQIAETLKDASRGASAGAGRQRLRSTLVVAEVALSVALLIGAGLLLRSFARLQQVEPGFEIDRLVTMRVNLPRTAYPAAADARAFYERLLSLVGALPGVRAAATSSGVPLTSGNTMSELRIPGQTTTPGVPVSADWRLVSPGYFASMNIPLRGRDFDQRDVPKPGGRAMLVTIVSETMARRFWPGEDPIGKTVVISSFDRDPHTIIGVAGDVRSFGLDTEVGPMVYGSAMAYAGWNPMSLVVRSALDDPLSHADGIRGAIRQIDPKVPVYEVREAGDLLTESFGSRRFNMYLLGCFAAIAMTLAAVGLFGVLAYLVSQRSRDIGIRLALGAARGDIVRLIVGQGMGLAIAGAALGVMLALTTVHKMQSLIFSVSPRDPLTFVAVPVVLLAVALSACYLPARRAMRVDPLVALRSE